MAGIVGLVTWTIGNSDRVLKLLQGLLDRLPAVGGAMETAGGTMVSLGAAIQGADGKGGALGEVDVVRALLARQKEAYAAAVADLREAAESLRRIQVPNVRVDKRALKLPLNAGSIDLPVVETSDATPLAGVADTLERQIAQLAGLADPLQDAADGLGNRGILGSAAAELEKTGAALRSGGSELKALAAA
jgi:hypothetical protein